jgi:hypothetical protein
MKTNNGGSAFPGRILEYAGELSRECPVAGMSLRDWLAGMSLSSMIIAPDYSGGPCNSAMAGRAYAIADAMLAERAKGEK